MTDITWTNDTRKLSDLVPWEHNPKRMTRKQAAGLRLSIERFGFAVPFLVSPDYVAVCLERWATTTGQTPALLDGAP